jgi:hypothetical protein
MLYILHCFLIMTEIWCVIIQGDSRRMKLNYFAIDGEWLLRLPFNCLYIPGNFILSPASFTPSASCRYFGFPRFRHDHKVAEPCPTQFGNYGLLRETIGLPAHTLWYRRSWEKKLVDAMWLLSPRYRSGVSFCMNHPVYLHCLLYTRDVWYTFPVQLLTEPKITYCTVPQNIHRYRSQHLTSLWTKLWKQFTVKISQM